MTGKEAQKFQKRPLVHTLWRTAQIAQAVRPAMRLADTEKKRNKLATFIDWGRVIVGGHAVYKVARGALESAGGIEGATVHARGALTQGQEFNLGGENKVKLPGWSVALLASGGVAALVGTLNYIEKERNETALKEAPQEAQAVKAAYDVKATETKHVKVNGQQVEVSSSQLLARDYADKFLQEAESEKGVDKRQIRRAISDARKLIQEAFSPTGDPALQEAVRLVAGDAFEAILLEKELPETAAVLTSRPRDKVIKFLRDLPARVDGLPVISWFTPDFLKKFLRALGGEQALSVGNLNLDPRSFIGAGSEKTLGEVQHILRSQFESIIADEESHDATGAQVALINNSLPTGLKVSDTAKDGKMNTIVASVLIQERPELSPKVAEIVGVLDAVQNRPEVFGKDILSKSPSYRRRRR